MSEPYKNIILLADTDSSSLELLKQAVSGKARLVYTKDGDKAMQYLKENTPHMVFAAESLMNLSGRHLINAMRFTKHLKKVTAVLLKDSSPTNQDFDFADKIITKPIDLRSLQTFIAETLHARALKEGNITESKVGNQSPKHILIVEDSETIATLLERILEREGFSVTGVSTVLEATKLIEEELEQFHLALLDVNLPGGSGFDLLKLIGERSTMPSIILSALEKQSSIEESLALGAKEFIPKPFNPKDLVSRIRLHVGHT